MMVRRSTFVVLRLLVLLAGVGLAALSTLSAQSQMHTNGFAGKSPAFIRGEDNVRAEEKLHEITEESARSGSSSERIQVLTQPGAKESNFAYYYYPCPPAVISDEFLAQLYIKADHKGVRLLARVVFPHESDPKQANEPLTFILEGSTSRLSRKWEMLELRKPLELLKEARQKLRLQLNRDINIDGAYVDRLILDVYAGGGAIDLFVDDLRIGPVSATKPLPPPSVGSRSKEVEGKTTGNPIERGIPVKVEGNRLTIKGNPFFMRMIRYSGGVPLQILRDADLNTVLFDANTPASTIDEAVNQGFWIVPTLPLVGEGTQSDGPPTRLTGRDGGALTVSREAQGLVASMQKFSFGDGVLFWYLGNDRPAEQLTSIDRTAKAIRVADSSRPIAVDMWDGHGDAAQGRADLIGAHRNPLMTSMGLNSYRDYLTQRRLLTQNKSPNKIMWTWIQTHVPDWQLKLLFDHDINTKLNDPVGPQPEQIRLLTYLAIACGYQGIGYWNDKFLSDSTQGKDRWLAMALLNQELRMLEPLLLDRREAPEWIPTNNVNVEAAVIRSAKGVLILPVWIGAGSQYVPPQGALPELSMIVPRVPEGTEPWEISPGRVYSLQENSQRTLGGTLVKIPEFDLTSAVVFTSDHGGLVASWQNRARAIGKTAAQWSIELATEQIRKVGEIEKQLEAVAPPMPDSRRLFQQAEVRLEQARVAQRSGSDQTAYLEAQRALRPLRILMRGRWEQAVPSRENPTASPYTASYFSLPRHWQFATEVRRNHAGANLLADGNFERAGKVNVAEPAKKEAPTGGNVAIGKASPPIVQVSRGQKAEEADTTIPGLPGFTIQRTTLENAVMKVKLVSSKVYPDVVAPPAPQKRQDYSPSAEKTPRVAPTGPRPDLGDSILEMVLTLEPTIVQGNKTLPIPAALERSYLAVHTPAVKLPPGTLVRISAWIATPRGVFSSPDGVLFHDSIGGDALGIRILGTTVWKQYHLYRRVPESGVVSATVAVTGLSEVYVDNIKIEPYYAGSANDADEPSPAPAPAPKERKVDPLVDTPYNRGKP